MRDRVDEYELYNDLFGDRSNAIRDIPNIDDRGVFNSMVQQVAFSDESITITLDPNVVHSIKELGEMNQSCGVTGINGRIARRKQELIEEIINALLDEVD